MKLKKGYDRNIIDKYNKTVEEKIKKASKDLSIPIEKFAPKDIKGIPHMLGLFTEETRLYKIYYARSKKICLYFKRRL